MLDFSGREIQVGCFVVYAFPKYSNSQLIYGKVVELIEVNNAEKLTMDIVKKELAYDKITQKSIQFWDKKQTTINNYGRVLVIEPHQIPTEVFNLLITTHM